MQRRYITDNLINFRDLGGYPCRGGFTRFGRAFRCGIFRDPTEKDIALLKSLGIKTVIDLRGNEEAENMPSYFKDAPNFDYYHISLIEANPALARSTVSVGDLYIDCINERQNELACALRLIASLDEPFLFHCFIGKDRTGILAALLLAAAGCDEDDIIADYQVSYTYAKKALHREMESGSGLIWETEESKLFSLPENMEILLEYIKKNFSSAGELFGKIGLTEKEIESLNLKLI